VRMTLRTSAQQAEALRRQAAAEGRSMQAVELSAIDEYIARRTHKVRVAAALQRVVREEAGALESALARPRASVFGQDAYPDLHLKAAALLHSLAWNYALVDGNERLAWTACRTFLAINGHWISAPRMTDSNS
jgi:prophage maintenance system killer protein